MPNIGDRVYLNDPRNIHAWSIYTTSIIDRIEKALESGHIKATDIVWQGPSGDAVVAATAAELDEEYAEYVDRGQVSEYID